MGKKDFQNKYVDLLDSNLNTQVNGITNEITKGTKNEIINEKDVKEKELVIYEEGGVKFYSYNPKNYSNGGKALTKSMPVFFNPVMTLNRDLTMLIFYTFQQLERDNASLLPYSVCDTMAATGIRSLRLANLLTQPFELIINDLNPVAIRLIKKNLKLNNIKFIDFVDSVDIKDSINSKVLNNSFNEDIKRNSINVNVFKKDARILFSLLQEKKKYSTVIDIDPFGSPNIFIENAIKALKIGGLLAITATDTAVLFGIRPSTCMRKYNSVPLRSTFLKEVGIRILLYFTAIRAHPFNNYIIPYLSYSSDHYLRIFVKVRKGKSGVNKNLLNFGYIQWCSSCGWRESFSFNHDNFKEKCPNCASQLQTGGPLWLGPLHNEEFIEICRKNLSENFNQKSKTLKKIEKLLSLFSKENNFPPWYFHLHAIADRNCLNIGKTSLIISELIKKGHNSIRTHFDPLAIKTTASIKDIEDVLEKIS